MGMSQRYLCNQIALGGSDIHRDAVLVPRKFAGNREIGRYGSPRSWLSRNGRRFAPRPLVFDQSFEQANGRMKGRAVAFGCFAVPGPICELLTQELIGQQIVRFFEIRAKAEDSAVDAGLRLSVKKRPVVQPGKHEPLVDAVDHLAGLPARGVKAEVLQDDESVKGLKQPSVLIRAAPVASGSLEGEKLGSPAFGCNARALGANRLGRRIREGPA